MDWFKVATTLLDHVPDVVAAIGKLKTEGVITDAQAVELLKADSQRVVDGAKAWLAAHPQVATLMEGHPVPYTVPTPGPATSPPHKGAHMSALVDKIHVKIHNVSGRGQDADNKAEIIAGTGTQSLKQKVHLDATPSLGGKAYGGGDETVRSMKKADGSPAFDWRWTVGGKMAWNSQETPDPFNIGSNNDDDNGCTPAFNLQRQAGQGRVEVQAWCVLAAEDNGGVAVESNKVTWFID